MGRKRLAKNRGFPPNLYQNAAGYFYFLHPHSKATKGLGRDKALAFQEARAANAILQNIQRPKLAQWVTGLKEYTLCEWLPEYKNYGLINPRKLLPLRLSVVAPCISKRLSYQNFHG